MEVAAFDHMINNNLYEYSCDPWYHEPGPSNYYSVTHLNGQAIYKDEIFVIIHVAARSGSGGMDEGSPAGVRIIRINEVNL